VKLPGCAFVERLMTTIHFIHGVFLCGLILAFPLRGDDKLSPAPDSGPVVSSAIVDGPPIVPFNSNGDLWLNTWADDGNIYTGWGDGQGPGIPSTGTDCGIARLLGDLPNMQGEVRQTFAPKLHPQPPNDKPSSMLYLDGQLVGAFHSPLGDAWIGYLAVSKDYGATWKRIGFYDEKAKPPANASPWTRDKKSNFRCLFFVNMGNAYNLSTDGYVYAMGMGMEWNWAPKTVYLCRVPREKILDYSAYTYFTGMDGAQPKWSASQDDAKPLNGIQTDDMGSAMLHPQSGRYLFLSQDNLFEAPAPWGPWALAGNWHGSTTAAPAGPIEWQGGYMPGIISKGTGPDSFWFTISGQNQLPKICYRLQLGKIKMTLQPGPGARVTADPVSQVIGGGKQVDFSVTAAGDGPFTYQWQKDGKDIAGATQAQYAIKSTGTEHTGNYHCIVTNSHNRAISGDATLLVIAFCPPQA
jgi:hypothetical protein